MFCIRKFQSTLPARGATSAMGKCCRRSSYFNPRSPHGERHTADKDYLPAEYRISIHAPRTGSDSDLLDKFMGLDISIHAPRTGSDDTPPPSAPPASYFNPRSPHGERRFRPEPVAPTQDISIHAPRTGSDLPENAERITRRISIHAPRTGSDNPRRNHARQQIYFNPRSPHGERLNIICQRSNFQSISIHAPRTGSDTLRAWMVQTL